MARRYSLAGLWYEIKKENGYYDLYRKPLRRFEDLGDIKISNLELFPTKHEEYYNRIIDIINKIRMDNSSVDAEDIGIMFLENINDNYELAKKLQITIEEKFGWKVNIGYETKEKKKDTLFISNRNNVKGLEFPFVICFMQGKLTDNLQTRNSIYMMLTRSFITSYFILPDDASPLLPYIQKGINDVNKLGYLHIKKPKDTKRLNNAIIQSNNIFKSQKEIVDEILVELDIPKDKWNFFHMLISSGYKDEFDTNRIYEIIQTNYNMMDRK